MKFQTRRRRYLVAFAMAAGAFAAPAFGQAWPTKPVRIIVPHPPGGGTDIAARLVAQKLSETWKQSVIVENRAGAGGNIGTDAVARSAPDGYTLLLAASGTITTNVSLYEKIPFDPVKDLTPIALVAPTLFALVVPPSSPAKSVGDLIRMAKAEPGRLSFASASVGSSGHLSGELLKIMTGTNMIHVPYKGTGPAMTDLMAGNVTMMFADLVAAAPYIKAGRMKVLGAASRTRSPVAPDLASISDLGVPGFDVMGWSGLLGPAGLPDPIVVKINRDLLKVLEMPDIKEKLALAGGEFPDNSPQHFAAFIKSEIDKWRKVITASGARAE